MSTTEDRYKAAGLKSPAHSEALDATLTHVDPEVQPVDVPTTKTRARRARSRSPKPAATKNQEA